MALLEVSEINDIIDRTIIDYMLIDYCHEFFCIENVKCNCKQTKIFVYYDCGEVDIPDEEKNYTLTVSLPLNRSLYVCNKELLTISFNAHVFMDENALLTLKFDNYFDFACAIIFFNRHLISPRNALEKLNQNFTSNLQFLCMSSALISDTYPFIGEVIVENYRNNGRKEDEFKGNMILNGILSQNKSLSVSHINTERCYYYRIGVSSDKSVMMSRDHGKHQILIDEDATIRRLSFSDENDYFACLTILEYMQKKQRFKNRDAGHIDSAHASQSDNKALKSLMDELSALTGLSTVKNEVTSLVNLLRVQQMRKQKGYPEIPISRHMVFSGNPGTGKTTIARLLASIYRELGFLSKGHIIEVDRSGLVGGYIGQTAIKTQEVIQSSLGGILFIDEAYTLSRNENSNDYGQEAIDTILKAMEDNREDFIIIVAGYPDLMTKFIDSNPGLKSRFNKYIFFEDYTPNELMTIFVGMCKKAGYTIKEDSKDYVLRYFQFKYENRNKSFANGREVRNFFEKAIMNQADRISKLPNISDTDLVTLCIEDMRTID